VKRAIPRSKMINASNSVSPTSAANSNPGSALRNSSSDNLVNDSMGRLRTLSAPQPMSSPPFLTHNDFSPTHHQSHNSGIMSLKTPTLGSSSQLPPSGQKKPPTPNTANALQNQQHLQQLQQQQQQQQQQQMNNNNRFQCGPSYAAALKLGNPDDPRDAMFLQQTQSPGLLMNTLPAGLGSNVNREAAEGRQSRALSEPIKFDPTFGYSMPDMFDINSFNVANSSNNSNNSNRGIGIASFSTSNNDNNSGASLSSGLTTVESTNNMNGTGNNNSGGGGFGWFNNNLDGLTNPSSTNNMDTRGRSQSVGGLYQPPGFGSGYINFGHSESLFSNSGGQSPGRIGGGMFDRNLSGGQSPGRFGGGLFDRNLSGGQSPGRFGGGLFDKNLFFSTPSRNSNNNNINNNTNGLETPKSQQQSTYFTSSESYSTAMLVSPNQQTQEQNLAGSLFGLLGEGNNNNSLTSADLGSTYPPAANNNNNNNSRVLGLAQPSATFDYTPQRRYSHPVFPTYETFDNAANNLMPSILGDMKYFENNGGNSATSSEANSNSPWSSFSRR
jgi:hypothetical protein